MEDGGGVQCALLGVVAWFMAGGCNPPNRPAPAHEPSATASPSGKESAVASGAGAPPTALVAHGPSGNPQKLLGHGRCGIWSDSSIWCWEVHRLCAPRATCVPDRLSLSVDPDAARELVYSGDSSCVVLTNGRTAFEDDALQRSTLCRPDVLGAMSVEGYSESWGDACVLTGGDLICWDLNSDRRAWRPGDFTLKKSRRVLSSVAQIFGNANRCALRHGGLVSCWSIDDPARRAPKRVIGLPPIVQMDIGQTHTCAVAQDGRVFCWGLNMQGQLGMGKIAEQGHHDPRAVAANPPERATPQQVIALPPASQVAVTQAASCALTQDGEVYCWGTDDAGQPERGPHATATLVSGLPRITQLAADRCVCALTDRHETYCWGQGAPLRELTRTPALINWSGMPPSR